MPSGSHGGSRGSHRSGGARSSGMSFSSSFSRSSSSRRVSSSRNSSRSSNTRGFWHAPTSSSWHAPTRRPFRIHFGSRVYVFGNKVSLFIPFILIALFFIFMTSSMVSYNESYIKNIKVDYVYYHQMIATAEANPEYVKNATVTDKFYNEDALKWYFTYKVDILNSSMDLEGYTYSVYTSNQIAQISSGDSIKVAVNEANVGLLTDSIPMDFKNFDYKDDGEYIQSKKALDKAKTMNFAAWLAEIAFVVGLITYLVKTKKKEDQEALETKVREEEKHELEKKALAQDLEWRCEYCGKLNDSDKQKCQNCGAGKE